MSSSNSGSSLVGVCLILAFLGLVAAVVLQCLELSAYAPLFPAA